MGSLYFCENYDSLDYVPDDAVKTWEDQGTYLCLRPQASPSTLENPGWSEFGRFQASTTGCLWTIGCDTMVKVNSWTEGQQLEGRTIRFINERHPEIPTTRVIYEWVDPSWSRSFLIMRRAPGVLLDEAWHDMTIEQRQDVANEIASHIKTLTQHTSSMLETIDKLGVLDDSGLVGTQPLNTVPHWPSWKRWLHPRYTRESLMKRIQDQSGCLSMPDLGSEFVLYNTDLSSHNIFVQRPEPGRKGQLTQIIDWELTAYWPRYWIATGLARHPFCIKIKPGKPPGHWGSVLRTALEKIGFKSEAKWYSNFAKGQYRLAYERAGLEYEEYVRKGRLENSRPV